MFIIGVDYHPSDQYIAFVDTETGECGERRLNHREGEAEKFYRELAQRGVSVRAGMEATGYSRWFERLLAELGIEVWISRYGSLLNPDYVLYHSPPGLASQQHVLGAFVRDAALSCK